jgi:hypothetical protein
MLVVVLVLFVDQSGLPLITGPRTTLRQQQRCAGIVSDTNSMRTTVIAVKKVRRSGARHMLTLARTADRLDRVAMSVAIAIKEDSSLSS